MTRLHGSLVRGKFKSWATIIRHIFWVTLEGPQWVDLHGIAVAFELGTGRKEGHTEDPLLGETNNQHQQAWYLDNEQHRHPSTSTSFA